MNGNAPINKAFLVAGLSICALWICAICINDAMGLGYTGLYFLHGLAVACYAPLLFLASHPIQRYREGRALLLVLAGLTHLLGPWFFAFPLVLVIDGSTLFLALLVIPGVIHTIVLFLTCMPRACAFVMILCATLAIVFHKQNLHNDKYISIPFVLIHFGVAGSLVLQAVLARRKILEISRMPCEFCGYSLVGLPTTVCPECGKFTTRTTDAQA